MKEERNKRIEESMKEDKTSTKGMGKALQTINRAESIDLPQLDCFGPKPLIAGENEKDFDEMWRQIRHAAAPVDFIEEIWCRDIVDTLWDSLRLRRLKAKLLEATRYQGLKEVLQLTPLLPTDPDSQLMQKWQDRETHARSEVTRRLNKRGLDETAIDAHALAFNADKFEKLDVMLLRAESRRHLVMQEMQRRKEFQLRMKQAARIVDAEFEDVTPGGPAK